MVVSKLGISKLPGGRYFQGRLLLVSGRVHHDVPMVHGDGTIIPGVSSHLAEQYAKVGCVEHWAAPGWLIVINGRL